MASKPTIQLDATIDAEKALRRLQDVAARRPLKVNLATDARGLDSLNKGLGKLSGSADEFTKSLEAANARVLAFGASVAVISALQRGFVNLVKSTVEVEASFAKIAVVGDQFAATAGQLEKFGRGIFDVARQTGQSFDETSKAALEFARQGLGAAETLTRVKDALTLTRLSGLDATSAVEGLTAAVNSFKKEGLSTTDILNKLIAVDNKYAVSSGDLIEAIKRSGSFAQEAGIGFDELTATVTVLQEATARGGSVIGNSLKTIFERVGRPESLKQLRDLGVEIYDAKENILPAIKILDNFSNKLNDMGETAKRSSLRQLAGTLQINQLSALSNALKEVEGGARRYDEVLATSANASNEAGAANEKLNKTLDAQIKGLLATGTQLGSLFGNIAIAPSLQGALESLGEAGDFLIKGLSKDGPSFTKAFASVIGDAIIAAGVAGTLSIGLILKKFASFAKDSFSNILGINSAAKNQEAIQISILNTLRTRGDIENILLGLGSNQVAQAKLLASYYKQAADEDARRITTSKILSKGIASGFGVGPTGQPSPRGRSAASGFVPDLIQAEYADIKKGVGGANKNSGVVLINDFPFGGGKRGPMVANSSEGIMPMGSGAAVLNKDMLDRMGYGKRAAQGFKLPVGLSPQLKSGKFSNQSSIIESAVNDLVQLLVGYGKSALDINNSLRKIVSGYDLQEKSVISIVKAGNEYARTLELANQNTKQTVRAQLQNTKGGSSSAFGAAGKAQAQQASMDAARQAYIDNLKNQVVAGRKMQDNLNIGIGQYKKRLSEIQGSGRSAGLLSSASGQQKINLEKEKASLISNLKASQLRSEGIKFRTAQKTGILASIGESAPTQFPPTSVSEAQKKAQQILKERLLNKFSGEGSFGGGGRPPLQRELDAKQKAEKENGLAKRIALTDLSGLAGSVEKTKKTFSEASIEFGTQFGSIFLSASVAKEGLNLIGVEADKTVDVFRNLAGAYVGFKKLGEIGGVSSGGLSSLGGKIGDFAKSKIPGAGKLIENFGPVIDGLKKFGSGLLGALPVIGQVVVGLFAVNDVLKYFGVDAYASIREFVTGLSAEGERAKESLKTFSESLFENGQFKGKTREESFRNIQGRVEQQRELIRAKNLGVSTKDKSPDQIAGENFIKDLEKSLGGIKVGGTVAKTKTIDSLDGAVKIYAGERDKLFSDLNQTTQQIVSESIGEIFGLNIDELKSLAQQKNIKTTGAESRTQLATLVSQAAFDVLKQSGVLNLADKDLSNFNTSGTTLVQQQVGNFISPKRQERIDAKARNESAFARPEEIKAQVSAALELRKLQLDFATAEERTLETRIKTAQISDKERADLQANLETLKLERSLRSDIFNIASAGIDKLISAGNLDFVKQEELKAGVAQIRELGLSAEQTRKKFVELYDNLTGDSISEQAKKEILSQLNNIEKIGQEKKDQLKILNDQLKLEAEIANKIREQKSLTELSFATRKSSIETAKSKMEGRLGILSAQGSNPNLSTQQQNSFRGSEIGIQIDVLRKNEEEARIIRDKARSDLAKSQKENGLGVGEVAVQATLITDEYNRASQSITDQISSLEIQKKLLGGSASSATLLANAAYQFKQNLGEVESSNILSALRATDISSLGSSLSSQKAFSDLSSSGKTGLDAEQFLAERTALRQKEFEIASATSKVQKTQLEWEKKALEDIITIKQSGGDTDEQIAALIEAQNKRLKEQRSIRSGIGSATAEIEDSINSFASDFGRTATFGFRDALSEALKAAASGTGDLKNALLDVALSFANKLRDAALDNLANIATNALFKPNGESSGGGSIVSSLIGTFTGKASGGKVTGGSGSKDDVPTLLMGGEYVVNKKMVKKYGPQFFEALNNGRVGGMASGGLFDPSISGRSITGAANLKKFANQSSTSGASDKMLSLGGGAAALELEPESLRLTNFARQSGNPLQSATQEAKDQALSLVFEDQNLRKQYQEQLDAIKKAKKAKQKQLLMSLAVAAIGAGVGGILNSGQASKLGSTSMMGGKSVGSRPLGLSNNLSSALSSRSIISSTSSASNLSSGVTKAISNTIPVDPSELYRPNQVGTYGILPALRASGGSVNGNGYGDNVPAMLSGGEFVMNRKAAKNLGLASLNAANAGQSLGVSEEKSEELNNRLLEKLNEVVEKLTAQNNVTVNVSMDQNGKATTQESGSQNDDQKNMNRRIKDAVVQVLQDEKRLGGVLRK